MVQAPGDTSALHPGQVFTLQSRGPDAGLDTLGQEFYCTLAMTTRLILGYTRVEGEFCKGQLTWQPGCARRCHMFWTVFVCSGQSLYETMQSLLPVAVWSWIRLR